MTRTAQGPIPYHLCIEFDWDERQGCSVEYVTVGKTGVRVSPLCFGAMSFGSEADEETSAAMFAACRDAGINFFDTSRKGGLRQNRLTGAARARR